MTNQPDAGKPRSEALDDLITNLLSCGGVLSQMIAHMVEFDASGRSAPDAAPIPEVAHSLIRSVLGSVGKRHSKRDIRVAARIVDEVTERICEEIFLVPPEFIDAAQSRPPGSSRRPSC